MSIMLVCFVSYAGREGDLHPSRKEVDHERLRPGDHFTRRDHGIGLVGEHTNRRSLMKISEACVWPAGLTRFARSVTTGSFGSVGISQREPKRSKQVPPSRR